MGVDRGQPARALSIQRECLTTSGLAEAVEDLRLGDQRDAGRAGRSTKLETSRLGGACHLRRSGHDPEVRAYAVGRRRFTTGVVAPTSNTPATSVPATSSGSH